MINADMRLYEYFTYGAKDSYGQQRPSTEPQGTIKIAIHITNQTTQDNINYKGANYIGVTHAAINDSYIIQYGDKKLKVLYVNPKGRYNIAFMAQQ